MAEPALTKTADGRWLLQGELSSASVPAILKSSTRDFMASREIKVDLKRVTRADSAGLVLLVEWLRESERVGKSISFVNVPEQLLAIARLCGVDEILSFQT